MRRIILSAALILTAASCGLSETEMSRRPAGGGTWRNPSFSSDSTSSGICYVTGLDYPEGYDWRADPDKGTVRCSLVVFADGKPIMKVPVGEAYHTGSDPDMHRMIGNHLYTDYSTASETIIKKDGVEMFRYPGREMIFGMCISEGEVFTLGQPREGDGFSYRKNGEIILASDSGRAFPRLQMEGDSLFFAYCEYIESAGGRMERYHQVMNGNVRQIAVREDIRKVWDVLYHDGEVYYLADLTGISSPVIISAQGMTALESSKGMKISGGRLFSAGRSLVVEALYSSTGVQYAGGIWKDGRKLHLFTDGMTICGISNYNEGISCVLNPGPIYGKGQIFRNGDSFPMPDGYIFMGSSPVAYVKGILYVGLSSLTRKRPAIWKDGKLEEIDLNGFICTLKAE